MITNPRFISLQGSYQHTEIALYEGEECKEYRQIVDKKASAVLIPELDILLKKHHLTLADLSFIALDQGPGAFTSLRVIITTVNGIAFATEKPLIGIDGIDALAYETFKETNKQSDALLVLLNAFNNEVYYGFYKREHDNLILALPKSYENVDTLLDRLILNTQFSSLTCVGNGYHLYKEKIEHIAKSRIPLFFSPHNVASAHAVGEMALKVWRSQQSLSTSLMPLYLKTQSFKPKWA
jgi:tRNA threonylcarbamoyladenosine biosynthesis protein TsaB